MQTVADNLSSDSELFDSFGRCLPGEHLRKHVFQSSRRYFKLQQPNIDFGLIYQRLRTHLHIETTLTAADFEARVKAILNGLQNDPATAAIANGVYVPFMLPKQDLADIGSKMDSVYLPAVKASFENTCTGKTFTNYLKDGLTGKLSIAVDSRHECLLDAQQSEVQVGVYFPALMEYSVPAAIEKVSHLPGKFMLAGGYDTAAALVGSPELLLRTDGYPPVLWLAALDTEKTGVNYMFEAYGYHLTFNRKPHFDQAAESWTSGLVVLG